MVIFASPVLPKFSMLLDDPAQRDLSRLHSFYATAINSYLITFGCLIA